MANLSSRDQVAHDAIAANIIHQAVIGPEPANHPEIQAFLSGFRLPCRNGFDFTKVCYEICCQTAHVIDQRTVCEIMGGRL